jgi:hypothetical protein
MSSILDLIRKNRPKLGESSLKTYNSTLSSLYRKIKSENDPATPPENYFVKNQDKVLDFLSGFPLNGRKTALAGLVVLCQGDEACQDKYRAKMMADIQKYKSDQMEQEKTDKQKDSWITQEEINRVYNTYHKNFNYLANKTQLTQNEIQQLQNLVILSVYTLIPPRRLLDYTEFKVRNIDPANDNYMQKRTFRFNKFKTAKTYGEQTVAIPPKLQMLINRYMKHFEGDHLLFDQKGNKMNPSKLNQRLHSIFNGKKIGVNQLRHTYVSDVVLKDMPKLSQLNKIATDMGHSVENQILYKKV